MAISGGWTPLSGPKVPAEATHPDAVSFPFPALPAPPIPHILDDGFLKPECCGPAAGSCGGGCGSKEAYAVNVATGKVVYRYQIPENSIPLYLTYETDAAGVTSMGSNGWRLNYHRSLKQFPGLRATLTCSDGCIVDYSRPTTSTLDFYPSAGIDSLISADSTNTLANYTETQPGGLQYKRS